MPVTILLNGNEVEVKNGSQIGTSSNGNFSLYALIGDETKRITKEQFETHLVNDNRSFSQKVNNVNASLGTISINLDEVLDGDVFIVSGAVNSIKFTNKANRRFYIYFEMLGNALVLTSSVTALQVKQTYDNGTRYLADVISTGEVVVVRPLPLQ